jgi:hypothetical protein
MLKQRLVLLSCFTLVGLITAACMGGSESAAEIPVCAAEGSACAPASTPGAGGAASVDIFPGDDWQAAVDANPEGTTFEIKAGLHRLAEVIPKDGNAFIGEPGALLNGAKLLTEFVLDGPYWVADAELSYQGVVHGVCIEDYEGCSYPQDVFLDDAMLWQVTDLGQGGPGRWYFDYETNKVYLWDDPTAHKVELSTTEFAFYGTAKNVAIRGLIIEKYMTRAQGGAINARDESTGALGENWLVEQNEIRLNHGAGIHLGPGMQVLNNYIHHNGQIGIRGGEGGGILIEGNEIAFNNIAGFESYWEAGGAKFLSTRDLVVRANYVHDNDGPGLWTDFDNVNALYEANNVEGNDGIGIQHEISYSAVIRNNVARDNGAGTYDWLWGAQIMISGSSDVEVYENIVVSPNGGQGIAVQQDSREEFRTRNVYVHHNEIVGPGVTGADENPPDPEMYGSVLFDFNHYQGTHTWFWDGAVSWDGFQEAGQEANGTTDLETVRTE